MASRRLAWLALILAVAALPCGCSSTARGPATSLPEPGVPAKDNILSGVACPSATVCIAVGHVGEGANQVGPDNRTLIEQNAGGGWQLVPSPNAPNEAGSELFGVTCISAHDCIAVGRSDTSASTPTTLIEQDAGSGWAVVPSPNANAYGGIGSLSGVACAGAARCVAVGDYQSENAAFFQTLIEENLGHGWNIVPSANSDPSEDNMLAAIACPSSSFCIAVGSRGPHHNLPLVEQETGSGWTLVPVPGTGSLSGIACPTVNRCFATGGNFSASGETITEQPLIEEMTDGRWSATEFSDQIGELGGVACPTVAYCMSVGGMYSFGLSTGSALVVAELNGSAWKAGVTSDIGSQSDSFIGVACTAVGRCVAVGKQHVGTRYPGADATFIAEHTSQGWAVVASPNA